MTRTGSTPEIRLVAATRFRVRPRYDTVPWPDEEPALDALVATLDPEGAGPCTLSGAEPALRADLPKLIAALADAGATDLGLATDGWALVDPRPVATLARAGLSRVRLPLASARVDANDWLAGASGATRRVRRALETCVAEGLSVTVDCPLTRPTAPFLGETVEVVAALGARAIAFRAPPPLADPTLAITLMPRLDTLREELEAAVRLARRRGLRVTVHGLPRCTLDREVRAWRSPEAERWVLPDGPAWAAAAAALRPEHAPGCPECALPCPGVRADYVALFGRAEIDPRPGPDDYAPATPPTGTLRLRVAPVEPSRSARTRLVHAIQQRPAVLELEGWLSHPDRSTLLPELRLLEPELVLVDALDPLDGMTDRALGRLAELAAFDAALHGSDEATHDEGVGRPGALVATRRTIARLREAGATVRGHVAFDAPGNLDEYEVIWHSLELPGAPVRGPSPAGVTSG